MVERLLSPTLAKFGFGDADGFCCPGSERRDSSTIAGVDTSPVHVGNDLCPSTRECFPHVGADSDDLGDAVAVDLVEHDASTLDQFTAQCRLEDRFGGVAQSVEVASVERGAAAVGAFGDVEDGLVEMDARVAESAGAMHEHRAKESPAVFDGRSSVASSDEAAVGFEEAFNFATSGVQAGLDGAGVVVGAERPQQRHPT